MTKQELFEEVRTLLRDAQVAAVSSPYRYGDEDLTYQIRSALRWARTQGVVTDAAMSTEGELAPEPSEPVGLLLAYRTAANLLQGDLISRLHSGELGMYFRAGDNIIDTKTAAGAFRFAAALFQNEVASLLFQLLSENNIGDVYGGPTLSV